MEIGHEMYHRVTGRCKELQKELWIDEMLACTASYQLLKLRGFEAYAFESEQSNFVNRCKFDVQDLYRVKRRYRMFEVFKADNPYPQNFGNQVISLGQALLSLVGWENLCKLSSFATLEQWVASCPKEQQYGLCRILDVPIRFTPALMSMEAQRRLGIAMRWIGNYEEAIIYLEKAVSNSPLCANAHYELGTTFFYAQRVSEAIEQLYIVTQIVPKDVSSHFTLGNYLKVVGNLDGAADELECCLTLSPNYAAAHYHLGNILDAKGEHDKAREEWSLAATLGDHITAAAARSALGITEV